VLCEACRLPLGSSAEQRGHQCTAESAASSQLSISLLARAGQPAAANLGPPHRLDFSSLGGQEGVDEEIIEGTSEVAGPSRARSINNNNFDSFEAARAESEPVASDSPIKIVAEKDSQELELSLHIDPAVHCTRLRVRVPLRKDAHGDSLPLSVSANYTNLKKPTDISPTKQSSIKDFFGGGRAKEDSLSRSAFEEVLRRARKKGFVAPDLNMLKPMEQNKKKKKQCPWYKIMKDTSLAVDAFNYGAGPHITHYLLSHFHSDHYVGLSKSWSRKIVCSPITMRLAISKFNIRQDLFLPVEPGEERLVAGVQLTALDANHCPGSLMFVLRTTSGLTILHTGDFRACAEMESAPILWDSTVDRVYLDTTYCRPQYDLPSQSDVIAKTVHLVGEFVAGRPGTAVLVGAYAVGKERLFKAVAEELDARVWTGESRVAVWRCLQDRHLLDRLVGSRAEARVQVVDSRLVTWGGLGQELDRVGELFTHVLGVRPTGWAHSRGEGQEGSLADVRIVTKGQLSLLEVPYSEHSSFSELKRFIKFLRIKEVSQIVPTVNRANCAAMEGMFGQWIQERQRDGPDSQ
jgi:DNA cross-link repair 1A protein